MQKVDGITVKQAEMLYNLNCDGWISLCTRNRFVWGECARNSNHTYRFTYSPPEHYKVVIVFKDGTVKISDEIYSKEFNNNVFIDVSTMHFVNINNRR